MLDLSRHNSTRAPQLLALPAWELTFTRILASTLSLGSEIKPSHGWMARILHLLCVMVYVVMPAVVLVGDTIVFGTILFYGLDVIPHGKGTSDIHVVLRGVYFGSMFASWLFLIWDILFLRDNRKNDRILDACLDSRLYAFHTCRGYSRWCVMRVVLRTRTFRSWVESIAWWHHRGVLRIAVEAMRVAIVVVIGVDWFTPTRLLSRGMKRVSWTRLDIAFKIGLVLAIVSVVVWVMRFLLFMFAWGVKLWWRYGMGLDLADEIRLKVESRLWRLADMERKRQTLGAAPSPTHLHPMTLPSHATLDPYSRHTIGPHSSPNQLHVPLVTTSGTHTFPAAMHRYQSYRSSLQDISLNIPAYLPDSLVPPSSINILPSSHMSREQLETGHFGMASPTGGYEGNLPQPSVASTASSQLQGPKYAVDDSMESSHGAMRRWGMMTQGSSLVSNAATTGTPESSQKNAGFVKTKPEMKSNVSTLAKRRHEPEITVWPKPEDLGMSPPTKPAPIKGEEKCGVWSKKRFRSGRRGTNESNRSDDRDVGLTSAPLIRKDGSQSILPPEIPKRKGWAWYRKKYRESIRKPEVITSQVTVESPRATVAQRGSASAEGIIQLEEFDWSNAGVISRTSTTESWKAETTKALRHVGGTGNELRVTTSGLQSAFASTNNSPASAWSRHQPDEEDIPHIIEIPESTVMTLQPPRDVRASQKSVPKRARPDRDGTKAQNKHVSLTVPESPASSPNSTAQPGSQQSVYIFDFYKDYYSRSPPSIRNFILHDVASDAGAPDGMTPAPEADVYKWAATATVGRSTGTFDRRNWRPRSPPRPPPMRYSEWDHQRRSSLEVGSTAQSPQIQARAISFVPPPPEVNPSDNGIASKEEESYGVRARSSGSIQQRLNQQMQSPAGKSIGKRGGRGSIPRWWTEATRYSPPTIEVTKSREFKRPAFASSRKASQPVVSPRVESTTTYEPPPNSTPMPRKPSTEEMQMAAESWRHSMQIAPLPLDVSSPQIPEYTGLNSTFTTPVQSRHNSVDVPHAGSLGPHGIPIPQVEVFDFDAIMREREERQRQRESERQAVLGKGVVMTPDSGDRHGFSGGMLLETGSVIQDLDSKSSSSGASSWIPVSMTRKKSIENLANSARRMLSGIGRSSTLGSEKDGATPNQLPRKGSAPAHVVSDMELREAIAKSNKRTGRL